MFGDNPVTVKLSLLPDVFGVGSPLAGVAELQLLSLIVDVEYRISYCEAVPEFPSSPGAVQAKVMLLDVGLLVRRSDTAAGGETSLGCGVLPFATFDKPDQLGFSSDVLRAK